MAETVTSEAGLFQPPEVRRYGAGELDALREYLDRQDARTLIDEVSDPELLLLRPDGRTADGLRLGASVFQKLCGRLSAGLLRLLGDLSGSHPMQQRLTESCYSAADAVDVFNLLLRRRGRQVLGGFFLLRDVEAGTIDGLYASQYIRLGNGQFLEQATAGAEGAGYEFESAALAGRELACHFASRAPLCRVGDDAFYPGLYYANSESGDTAARASYTLMRQDGLRTVAPFRARDRVHHKGSQFYERLTRLLQRAPGRTVEPAWLEPRLEQMARTRLGLAGSDDEHDLAVMRRLVQLVRLRGFTEYQARYLVRMAMAQAADEAEPAYNLAHVKRAGWPLRTVYDLFIAALRAPTRAAIPLRERSEQGAYRFFSGTRPLAEQLQ